MTAAERIEQVWYPAWIKRFKEKAADYNTAASKDAPAFQPHEVLGVRGQFADIWRKVWKLKKALWDGQTLVGEQPREIIEDLISHLFLTLDLLDKQQRPVVREALPMDRSSTDVRNSTCGPECTPRSHLFADDCRYRLA